MCERSLFVHCVPFCALLLHFPFYNWPVFSAFLQVSLVSKSELSWLVNALFVSQVHFLSPASCVKALNGIWYCVLCGENNSSTYRVQSISFSTYFVIFKLLVLETKVYHCMIPRKCSVFTDVLWAYWLCMLKVEGVNNSFVGNCLRSYGRHLPCHTVLPVLHGTPISELRVVTCHVTQCYLYFRQEWTRPAITPARQAGTRFTCPPTQ